MVSFFSKKCIMFKTVCTVKKYGLFCDMLVDNGPRQGLDKFLKAASDDPETVLHYEFMQDYKVNASSISRHSH